MTTSMKSFGISLGLHVLLGLFFTYLFSSSTETTIIKIPSGGGISVNLGSFQSGKGQTKSSPATNARRLAPAAETKTANLAPTSTEMKNLSSPSSVGAGVTGTSQGAGGGNSGGNGNGGMGTEKDKYFVDLRNMIEAKKEYPTMARMRGIQGVVVVALTIKKDGEILNHRIEKASGHALLDQAALNLVKKINRYKNLPEEIKEDEINLKFPIAYQLNG